VKNFTISLYAFHLRHTLSNAPGEVVEDANLLWENLVKLGKSALPFPVLKDLPSKLIYSYQNGVYEPHRERVRKTQSLTDVGVLDLGSLPTTEGFKIHGNLQPFLLNDTYAVDLTLIPESSNLSINIPQLQHFSTNYLLPSHIQASLGQTLWIYGEVEPNEDCDALAEKFATALVGATNLNPVRTFQGELFGSQLFEYQATDSNEPDNPTKQCQILLVINNNSASTVTMAEKAYDWLLNLLCAFHKIRYIYYQARTRYQDARKIYSYLEKTIQKFNSPVTQTPIPTKELEKILAEIPQKSLDYNICLQDLQIHSTALLTNITNYRICLEEIASLTGVNNPQFWVDFLNKDCQKYTEQTQIYINYLTPSQQLFQQVVDTIRGIVETRLQESARSLEQKIQIIGIAFGGGAIVSGVVTQHIDKPFTPINVKYPFHPMVSSLFWSILATIAFGLLAWFVTKSQYNRNK
jgi:hypothetical protein